MGDSGHDSAADGTADDLRSASDEMLLLGIRMRDETALLALYDRYSELVFTLAARMLDDREAAEGLLEEVFLRCWRGAASSDRAGRTVPGWLLGQARSRAIELRRERAPGDRSPARAVVREADSPDATESAGASGDGQARPAADDPERTLVVRALAELSPPQREAIELAYFDGLTQAEVAARLGLSIGTVKVRLRDGVRRLRALLGPTLDGHRAGAGGR